MSYVILTRLVLLHLLAVLIHGVGAARYIIWPRYGITEQQSITLDGEINDQAGPQGNVYQSLRAGKTIPVFWTAELTTDAAKYLEKIDLVGERVSIVRDSNALILASSQIFT